MIAWLELFEDIYLLHYTDAIVAAEPQGVLLLDGESWLNRFRVRYASWIRTSNYPPNRLWQLDMCFFGHLIVSNYADGCTRGNQGYLVYFSWFQFSVLDLDNILLVLLLRDNVHRNANNIPLAAVVPENLKHVQRMPRKNVIYDGSIPDLLDVEILCARCLGQDCDPAPA